MNKKTFLLFLTYLVLTFVCAVGWHLALFKDYYMGLTMRREPLIQLGVLSMLIQAGIMAYLYPLFYKGGEPLKTGAKFGLIMGLFMGSYGVLAEAGKFDVGPLGAWFLHEGIYFPLQFTIIGAVMGLIYGRSGVK
ncbi:MAG TPA: DUF1761 domain-containing protein [bacterium]|nr:DUF1761 domain-containing protein [bacterium]